MPQGEQTSFAVEELKIGGKIKYLREKNFLPCRIWPQRPDFPKRY